jgi:hypothetical protein
MPFTPEYYLKRAEEVENAASQVTDPILREAYELWNALRAMAGMAHSNNEKKPKQH